MRRDELLQTVQTLERLMEQGKAEHAQLLAERDTLADCVRSLQELQQQPPAPTELRAQVIGSHRLFPCDTVSCAACITCGTEHVLPQSP